MHQLSQIRAKIFRAEEHFSSLKSEISDFMAREPYAFVKKCDGEMRTVVTLAQQREEIPLSIRIITGEIIMQLRSVLDYLAWQLALLETATPGTKCEFPIFESAATYKKDSPRKTLNIPADARAVIDSLQPHACANPSYHPLQVINMLANIEKHRLLTVVAAGLESVKAKVPPSTKASVSMHMGAIVDQTELMVVTVAGIGPLSKQPEVEVDFSIGLALVHEKWETPRHIEKLIPELISFTIDVVRQFECFFPEELCHQQLNEANSPRSADK